MKVLVANLGSTSFKYRLYDMPSEQQMARGGIERIGAAESRCYVQIGDDQQELTAEVPDHSEAVRRCLAQLTDPESGCLTDPGEVAAIGFKTVHGGRKSGVQIVDDEVLEAMAEMNRVAPAHNPPYIAAMRQLREQLPEIPLVAAFETDFHQTIPQANRTYGVPRQWEEEFLVRRWGFHGASHRFIATRVAEILGRDDLRVISCHLGGSSSLTAIRNGKSVATSMGCSPQTGVLQNNRVGDIDPYALSMVIDRTGQALDEVLEELSVQGGLLGISGVSGDVRDLREAAASGNERAQLALDTFVANIRQYLGWMLIELGGADAIVFTGGIGENDSGIRQDVCRKLDELGILIDEALNNAVSGEAKISADDSRVQIWVVPTHEEIVVARQVYAKLEG
ncbi:MAG: acetate/propionate family kinase [Planctomycetota bacterium]|nr:acetate/propionate family kinase [Planctomycetota bacterium]